jgi:hypothetical protein
VAGNGQALWEGNRANTPPAYARRWGAGDGYAGTPEWQVPGRGTGTKILGPNKYGDYGYTTNHYSKITTVPKESC